MITPAPKDVVVQEPLLSEIINRVIIVDDSDNDIKTLRKVLEAEDISVESYLPEQLRGKLFKRNRQLVFMDLYLYENLTISQNIDKIIGILSTNLSDTFGLYGLVIWTNSDKEVEKVKRKIGDTYQAYLESIENRNENNKESDEIGKKPIPIRPPLFIVNLSKNKYLEENSYATLLPDLQMKLQEDTAACFFTSWYSSVIKGVGDSIHDIYRLAPKYPERNEELPYLLYKLGINHVGINEENVPPYDKITEDAFKAFDELLEADLSIQERITQPLKDIPVRKPWDGNQQKKRLISAQLNSKLFIDSENISKFEIVPGNVYKVLDEKSPLIISDKPDLVTSNVKEFINIAIELTPPCDYSHKKVGSRLVGGYAFVLPDINAETLKKISKKIADGEKLYSLWLVQIDGKVMALSFDFRYLYTPSESDLKNEKRYQLWFRAKPKLFADVLQKFSSHAARLGLSNINLS